MGAGYTAIGEGVASGTAAGGRTVLQLTNPASNPAPLRGYLYGYRFSAKGIVSNAEPPRWLICRQTDAGAGGVALAAGFGPTRLDPLLPASTVTCLKGPFGTEPTRGDVVFAQEIHPQSGWGEYIPLGDEIPFDPGSRLAVVVVAAATVLVTAQLYWRGA
ncbi:hypothetical protein SAMN05421505_12093 [Sinosporangium album]|uniref:Uncharacterized protein n=1 Tax=Sinosporangium album TaxID=504805 RepID=A0A1G8EGJ1_9ACTN|nr:hypothetical protein [Sinosporangium album]SDH69053.1 hypothetical protein SAMN05421505_12093 [Sinosporangium album]